MANLTVSLLAVLGFLPLGNYAQWTLLHSLHCVIHYLAFHYNTGVPWTETRLMQGKYDPLTFWEALDIRYDHHKVPNCTLLHLLSHSLSIQRFLIIVPILVFLTTINSDTYPPSVPHLLLNTAMLALALLPKYSQAAKNKIRANRT
jgi:hypothetical protein